MIKMRTEVEWKSRKVHEDGLVMYESISTKCCKSGGKARFMVR